MTREKLHDIYLDYRNNFLTIKGYANYYDISEQLAEILIKEAEKSYIDCFG